MATVPAPRFWRSAASMSSARFWFCRRRSPIEAKEIKSEFRVLEIELAQPVITDGQQMAAFDALNGRGPLQAR